MHRIIKHFVETNDSIQIILQRHSSESQYLESTFLKLSQYYDHVEVNKAIINQVEDALVRGHSDSNLYLLFLSMAISYCHKHYLFERQTVFFSIGKTISQKNIHPLVSIYWNFSLTFLNNDRKVEAEVLKNINSFFISKKNINSPRYKPMFINYSMLLGMKGMLNNNIIIELKNIIKENSKEYSESCTQAILANSIMTGQYDLGSSVLKNFLKNNPEKNLKLFQFAKFEIEILKGGRINITGENEFYDVLANAYNLILDTRYNESKKCLEQILDSKEYFLAKHFLEYIPLHIELSKSQIGTTNYLLSQKIENGKTHYLDDLFFGRMHLLEKNFEKVDFYFSNLICNVEKYTAKNRLIFELQFAKEMKLTDIVSLINGWQKNTLIKQKALIPSDHSLEKKGIFTVGIESIIGKSEQIKAVKKWIKKFATIDAPILITGETGTGKELAARAIHEESDNSKEPFLAINCGAFTESLLQSELFGHVAGSFTGAQKEHKGIFEAAENGTVFLDEFGEISHQLQISLLRVLQEYEIRKIGSTKNNKIKCKIIIATNINLKQLVAENKFRKDLYYRIVRFEIKIPALRNRIEDLEELLDSFLNKNLKYQEKHKMIPEKLLKELSLYQWPGNIRELKNEAERIRIIHYNKEVLDKNDFTIFEYENKFKPQVVHNPDFEHEFTSMHLNEEEVLGIINRGSKVERRKKIVISLFQKYKKLTRSNIVAITNVNAATASKELKSLCEEGVIIKRQPTKSPRSIFFELLPQSEVH